MDIQIITNKSNKVGLTLLDDIKGDVKRGQKMSFIDDEGYKYSYDYGQINDLYKHRYRLSIVNNKNPFTIYNIQKYIDNHNGDCTLLSTKWDNNKSKLKLRCSCGNIYEARWYHIFNNRKFKCNKCAYANPYNKKSIDEVKALCIKHGYHLIKDTYKNRKCFDMIDKYGYKYSNCSIYTLDKRTNRSRRFSPANKYQLENMKINKRIIDNIIN